MCGGGGGIKIISELPAAAGRRYFHLKNAEPPASQVAGPGLFLELPSGLPGEGEEGRTRRRRKAGGRPQPSAGAAGAEPGSPPPCPPSAAPQAARPIPPRSSLCSSHLLPRLL